MARILVILWSVLLMTLSTQAWSADNLLYTWVQWGQDGIQVARAIVKKGSPAPTIFIDHKPFAMKLRVGSADNFLVEVFEFPIPANTTSARLEDHPLPLAKLNPHKILVVGDTGCVNINRGQIHGAQNCADDREWPWPQISQRAATWTPDMVVHMGDYFYREEPCPACDKDSPYGNTWGGWDIDFFQSAKPLLTTAPWVMVRGNHEQCGWPGADGWQRFLSPLPGESPCEDFTPPYSIPLGTFNLIVLNTAKVGESRATTPSQVAIFQKQFAQIRQKSAAARGESWLLTHVPIYTPGSRRPEPGNDILQKASNNNFPPSITAIFQGHEHWARIMSFDNRGPHKRPANFVIGNGGAERLSEQQFTESNQQLPGRVLAGKTITAGEGTREYGYLTLERQPGGAWTFQLRKSDGSELITGSLNKYDIRFHQ